MKKSDKKKILYISDSLGLAIRNHRGISSYSLGLVAMLKNLGCSIDLLVERVDGYASLQDSLAKLSASENDKYRAIADSSGVSEIFRYFHNETFQFTWDLRSLESYPSVDDLSLSKVMLSRDLYNTIDRRAEHFIKSEDSQDLTPSGCEHLEQFDGFVWMDHVYSDAAPYCVRNLNPIPIDASDYDFVFLDAPHYLSITGIDRSHVFGIVHDVIPLTDASWSWDWRSMFVEKILASKASAGNLIFVSEVTKSIFSKVFPSLMDERNLIIYPTVTDELIRSCVKAPAKSFSKYIEAVSVNKVSERISNIKDRLRRQGVDPDAPSGRADMAGLENSLGRWDSTLPYVCTALSDEDRKNIPALVAASKHLIGKVNFIIMGKIDGNRYMNWEPEMFPNVHFTGFVSEIQKADIYRNASAVVFPSFSEGFGIPLVEGGLYQVPVICSDIPVFHEIGGELVRYFNPRSVSDLVTAVKDVVTNRKKFEIYAEKLYPSLTQRFSAHAMSARLEDYLSSAN